MRSIPPSISYTNQGLVSITLAHGWMNFLGGNYGTLEQFSANLSSFPEEGEGFTVRLGSLSTH